MSSTGESQRYEELKEACHRCNEFAVIIIDSMGASIADNEKIIIIGKVKKQMEPHEKKNKRDPRRHEFGKQDGPLLQNVCMYAEMRKKTTFSLDEVENIHELNQLLNSEEPKYNNFVKVFNHMSGLMKKKNGMFSIF